MKSVFRIVLALIFCAGFSVTARADIDQHCLSLCKANGGASSVCLTQCTFANSDSTSQVSIGTGVLSRPITSNGKVFAAPVPSQDLVLPKPQKSQPPEASKDYACVKDCLQNGGQYHLCNDRCMRSSCEVGSTQCKDLRGVAPLQVLPSTAVPLSTSIPR